MTDDDCVADENWVAALLKEFTADASLGLLGGHIELYDPRDLPMTIRLSRERMPFTLGAIAIHAVSANMAIRASEVAKIGPFDDDLGPGSPQLAGEELDFVYRAYKAGVKILYTPDAVVYHHHGRRNSATR